jgi:predicted secreted protein
MLVKKIILILAGITLVSSLWAGDSASFIDLGFSPDGKVYMFAQYGVLSGVLKPWADLFVVDVENNSFVSDGRLSYTHDSPILAGQDGSGALYRLIAKNSGLAARYGISFPNQGQPLYISLSVNPPAAGETIEFRNFEAGKSYRANLVSITEGSGENLRSSFYINLECNAGSETKTYTIGAPGVKRPLIAAYNIKKVIVDPRGDSIIFVIEMKKQADGGVDIRYMVEALRF